MESFYRHIGSVTEEAGELYGERNSCWPEIHSCFGT